MILRIQSMKLAQGPSAALFIDETPRPQIGKECIVVLRVGKMRE